MGHHRHITNNDLKVITSFVKYNPETGQFIGAYNKPLGWSRSSGGPWWININHRQYQAAKVAWAITYGADSQPRIIYHKNGNKQDNRLCNLTDKRPTLYKSETYNHYFRIFSNSRDKEYDYVEITSEMEKGNPVVVQVCKQDILNIGKTLIKFMHKGWADSAYYYYITKVEFKKAPPLIKKETT